MSGNETRKCANVTIIDDQTVEKEETFEVTFTFFLCEQKAFNCGEIEYPAMPICGKIHIIDDDGKHDRIKSITRILWYNALLLSKRCRALIL